MRRWAIVPPPADAPARLREQQFGFARHLRDPGQAPAPAGIEDRRLQIYRELFYNNVEGLLASNFPVLRKLLGDARWHALVRDFYREHRCHTPLFPEIGRELIRYLEARQAQGRGDPAFLLELAHYEWVELALALDETDLEAIACERDAELLTGIPVPSPLAWPLAYVWPVQQLRADFQPEVAPAQPTFLLVVRDRADRVQFKGIDALGFELMQMLHGNDAGLTGRALLRALAARLQVPDIEAFVAGGARMLEQLRARDAILGTRDANPSA
jgi:hypothetical protein